MRDWATGHELSEHDHSRLADSLRGLGDGAALQEADLDGYVSRSKTLMVSRAAMAAQRAEVLDRRHKQLDARDEEVSACEEAMVRAEVRIAARERMVITAIQALEHLVGASAGGEEADRLKRARFAQTVTMTRQEAQRHDEAAAGRRKSGAGAAPPVLDLDVPTAPVPQKARKDG